MSVLGGKFTTSGLCGACESYLPSPAESDIHYRIPCKGERTAILLSGGKDSCYAMTRMKMAGKRLDLAIFVDNGFSAPKAIENCRRICNRFDTDFLHVRSHIKVFRRSLRRAFLRMRDEGMMAYEAVDFTDGSMIFNVGRMAANEHHIWNVVCGLSTEQVEIIAGHDQEMIEDDKGKLICPLVKWKPSDAEMTKYLNEHVGIESKHLTSFVTNNSLIPVMCALDIKNHGYCSFEPEFGRRVRKGEASYEQTRNLWEFLEWSSKRGLLDGKIKSGLLRLGISWP